MLRQKMSMTGPNEMTRRYKKDKNKQNDKQCQKWPEKDETKSHKIVFSLVANVVHKRNEQKGNKKIHFFKDRSS